MKFESAINICQSNCGILHLGPLHLCKDMHSFDAATMPGCNFSILMGILCDYPQIRSSKITVPCRAMLRPMFFRALPCRALPCRTLLCRTLLCRVLPCLAMLCHAVLCPAVSCPALSCHAMSCLAVPCLALLCRVLPFHVLPYHALPDVCNAGNVLI